MQVATLVAVLAGPILAVLITRYIDTHREEKVRRMDIFRTVMRTRRTPIVPGHVGALNLIEIEFAKDAEIIEAWKRLFKHLGTNHACGPDEIVSDTMDLSERGNRNRRYEERLGNEQQTLLAKLLHALAKQMGFKIEQLEIFEGGYTPQGWKDVEFEQQIIRRFFLDLYLGKCLVPVGAFDYTARPPTTMTGDKTVPAVHHRAPKGDDGQHGNVDSEERDYERRPG